MRGLGKDLFDLGMTLFEEQNYDQAVQNFIKAYELGFEKDLILENLYSCFILPNELEFKNNYSINAKNMINVPFEQCTLDFIPVSGTRFYIFDKVHQEFQGVFELEQEAIQKGKEEFDSLLFTDVWDIRVMIPYLKKKKWEAVYILLEDLDTQFASFFKLGKFKEVYLENVVLFQNIAEMYAFFEQFEDKYLPKTIVTPYSDKYYAIIWELHTKRIQNIGRERNNIFLSICMPSYNRGTSALKNVQHLLECVCDSEIEIVISNNGSTEDTEGYQEIKRLADARIRYHEFDENQGFASNVLKTLELARGQYVVLTSDEDIMILENMGEYLSYLKQHRNCGVFRTQGIGKLFSMLTENRIYQGGTEAISAASNLNYMTGITYNMRILKQTKTLEIVKKLRGNIFLEFYVHIPLALVVAQHAGFHDMKIILWDARSDETGDTHILKYMLPESRIEQQQGIMEIYDKALGITGMLFVNLFIKRVQKTYFLLKIAYITRFESYYALSSWEELCLMVHKENIRYLEGFPITLMGEVKKQVELILQDVFLLFLSSSDILAKYSEEERSRKEKLHMEIIDALQEEETFLEKIEYVMKQYNINCN